MLHSQPHGNVTSFSPPRCTHHQHSTSSSAAAMRHPPARPPPTGSSGSGSCRRPTHYVIQVAHITEGAITRKHSRRAVLHGTERQEADLAAALVLDLSSRWYTCPCQRTAYVYDLPAVRASHRVITVSLFGLGLSCDITAIIPPELLLHSTPIYIDPRE